MSTFLTMTFYGQYNLMVTTNASGNNRMKAINLISTILGPFVRSETLSALTVVLTHRSSMFASRSDEAARLDFGAKLTILFRQLYATGWKTACRGGSSIFDHTKRRGSIIFTLHNDPVDTYFACVKLSHMPSHNFSMIIPMNLESTMCTQISNEMTHRVRVGAYVSPKRYYDTTRPGDERLVGIRKYLTVSDDSPYPEILFYSKHMSALLKIIDAFHKKNFCLESSINVFGPADHNFLIFGYKSRPEPVSPHSAWAITVTKPCKVVLVNASSSASTLINNETSGWGPGTYWGKGDAYSNGKVALSGLLRKLAANGHHCLGSVDGLYKNSYYIFQQNNNISYQREPTVISCSVVSDKKLQFNSPLNASCELATIMKKLDSCGLRMKTAPYANTIRVFEPGSFSYDSGFAISKHMAIYLYLLLELDKNGYDLYTAGNLSGRFDSGEERYISPHTWFFIKRTGRSIQFESSSAPAGASASPSLPSNQIVVELPPEFDDVLARDSDGLPTYEEAMRQVDATEDT